MILLARRFKKYVSVGTNPLNAIKSLLPDVPGSRDNIGELPTP
jgi:hypothetical protein